MSTENSWSYDDLDTQPIDIVVNDADIKISKPKEIPYTDDVNIISSPGTNRPGGKKKSKLGNLESGAIGVTAKTTTEKSKPKAQEPKIETVAIFSTRNVTWNGIGKVYRGYNIVPVSEADKWLTRDHIRLATPEEVAEEFGK
jgi:hypothetical protein